MKQCIKTFGIPLSPMRKLSLLFLLCLTVLGVQAQKISRSFSNTPMSAALKSIEAAQNSYTINFVYDELEDYKVTTRIVNATVHDAIRQVIGFYPIRLTVTDRNIFVEPMLKVDTKLAGQIIDERGQAVPFANVSLLSVADSSFLGGGVSNEAGLFVIPSKERSVIARFSCVGYRTVTRTVRVGPIGTVRMQEQTFNLAGVKKLGVRPTTRLSTGGFTTNVAGTLLADMGTAQDVLRHIPRVTEHDNAYEVFGKGTPLIYLNGRKLTDNAELARINANEIKHVEVITAPGVEYSADTRAVIRIKTIRREGNGLSGTLVSRYENNRQNIWTEQASLNYRHDNLDIFGSVTFTDFRFWNSQVVHTQQQGSQHRIEKVQATSMYSHVGEAHGNTGFNYQIDENNSFGATYSLAKFLYSPMQRVVQHYDVTTDGQYTGAVDYTANRDNSSDGPTNEIDLYYAGKLGKVALNFDGTALWKKNFTEQISKETSQEFENRTITSDNTSRNRMLAGKLVASYPMNEHLRLTLGTEYSHTRSHAVNINTVDFLPSSDDNITEDNAAAFASAAWTRGRWGANVGLRYEHINYRYYSYGVFQDDVSRRYSNLFPHLSLAYEHQGFHSELSMAIKTSRPGYYQLSNFLQYDDRYFMEGGNSLLQPERIYDVDWNTQYRWLTLSVNYAYHKDPAMAMSRLYDNTSDVVVSTFQNISNQRTLSVSASVQPVVGFWHPSIEVEFFKQFFDARRYGVDKTLQRPMWKARLNNSLVLPRKWGVGVDYFARTGYDSGFKRRQYNHELDLSVTKTLLKGALVLRMEGDDLLNTDHSSNFDYYDTVMSLQKRCKPRERAFVLTAQLRLYPVRSKYKGTGAGNEEKARM
jgi:hypothetical protein